MNHTKSHSYQRKRREIAAKALHQWHPVSNLHCYKKIYAKTPPNHSTQRHTLRFHAEHFLHFFSFAIAHFPSHHVTMHTALVLMWNVVNICRQFRLSHPIEQTYIRSFPNRPTPHTTVHSSEFARNGIVSSSIHNWCLRSFCGDGNWVRYFGSVSPSTNHNRWIVIIAYVNLHFEFIVGTNFVLNSLIKCSE